MTLYSLTFIFAFFPLSAFAYRTVRGAARQALLAALCLAFYILVAKEHFYILPILAVIVYFISFLGKAGAYICIAMLFLLRAVGIYEVGISFFILRAAAYIYDGVREKNILKVFSYLVFFPCVHAGPLMRYSDFARGFESTPDYAHGSRGICLFLYGAFKKLFFADGLYLIFSSAHSGTTAISALSALFSYAMYVYFDFCGCSDMARGIGYVFGFDVPKNFDFPYMSRTVSEFFRRWHITLGRWLRDYIYIPLGGSKRGKLRTVFSLLAVWLFSSLWHGTSLSYLVWGMYFFIICLLEKLILPENFKFGMPCTFLLVLFGWVFFFSDTPLSAVAFFTRLFCLGDTLMYSRADIYNLLHNAPFMLVCALFATPLPHRMLSRMGSAVYIAAAPLFLFVISCLAAGSHMPFLYAAF